MTEIEYHIRFPKQPLQFLSNELTVSINYIKSRLPSVLFFKLHFYGRDGLSSDATPFFTYTAPRWVVTQDWSRRTRTFDIADSVRERTYYTQLEFVTVGVSSENPIYFTEIMMNEGADMEYHIPHEAIDPRSGGLEVGLYNSRYVNLYDAEGNYLQVIRPEGKDFYTNKITASTCTVLAPHLANETDIDDPINIFMEFINQTEQRIDVLR